MPDWGTGLTELASLFLIVFLVYLLQCISWVSPGASVFALGIRGGGRRRYQGFVWSAFDIAGLLANPLPPLPPLLVCQWPAFELSADSIRFRAKEDSEPISISWEKLQVTQSDSKLSCNGSLAFRGSELQVKEYATLLGRLQRTKRGQREQVIQDWLRKMTNAQAAGRRVKVFAGKSSWVRILANLQLIVLFLLLPLGFREFGTGVLWRAILLLIAVDVAVVLEFWTLHKAILPEGKDQRFKSAITILFSPIAAIRAGDSAARDLLAGFHPLAAAAALLPAEEFREFAAAQLRECRFGEHASKEYQNMLRMAIERAIRQQSLDPEELLHPPDIQGDCVVYCPRCLAQYNKAREECTDCGYEGLAKLAGAQVPDLTPR